VISEVDLYVQHGFSKNEALRLKDIAAVDINVLSSIPEITKLDFIGLYPLCRAWKDVDAQANIISRAKDLEDMNLKGFAAIKYVIGITK
jgi:hypothetical protein